MFAKDCLDYFRDYMLEGTTVFAFMKSIISVISSLGLKKFVVG